jgi:hypothetical protein
MGKPKTSRESHKSHNLVTSTAVMFAHGTWS